MRKRAVPPASQLVHIREQKAKVRRKEVRLLQAELATLREQVRSVERELRQLGEAEAAGSAGRIRWTDVFQQLGDRFTAREMAKLTGARPMHIGTITHTWRSKGWIAATGERGVFRKIGRRRRS